MMMKTSFLWKSVCLWLLLLFVAPQSAHSEFRTAETSAQSEVVEVRKRNHKKAEKKRKRQKPLKTKRQQDNELSFPLVSLFGTVGIVGIIVFAFNMVNAWFYIALGGAFLALLFSLLVGLRLTKVTKGEAGVEFLLLLGVGLALALNFLVVGLVISSSAVLLSSAGIFALTAIVFGISLL